MHQQIFPIIDPKTLKIIGQKPRYGVHVDGDWHWGIQANIIDISDKENPKMLVQERSQFVDISPLKLDQSLATQMLIEDRGSRVDALKRGLAEELGLNLDKDIRKVIEIGEHGSLRILKTYPENPDLYNRELTTLFLLFIDGGLDIRPQSPRVNRLHRIPIEDLRDLIYKYPKKFTKTIRYYFVNTELFDISSQAVGKTIKGETFRGSLPFKSEFYSYENYDVVINTYKDGLSKIRIYNSQNSIKLTQEISKLKILSISADKLGVTVETAQGRIIVSR